MLNNFSHIFITKFTYITLVKTILDCFAEQLALKFYFLSTCVLSNLQKKNWGSRLCFCFPAIFVRHGALNQSDCRITIATLLVSSSGKPVWTLVDENC